MITTKRHGYLQVYLQTLCPPEIMDDFLIQLEELGITPGYEVKQQDFREYEFLYEETLMVIQYDAFLGICMYLNDMENATAGEEDRLLRLAAILQAIKE